MVNNKKVLSAGEDLIKVEYEPETYWQKRLTSHFNHEGVSHLRLGIEYNQWMYRGRVRALKRALADIRPDFKQAKVLDIGCGTGFWVDFWQQRRARIVGLDIAEKSVAMLAQMFPCHRFYKGDVSSSRWCLNGEMFDIVEAFDILTHVVDEDRFDIAISNIAKSTLPGGYVFITDGFLKTFHPPGYHIYFRTFERYQHALEREGISVLQVYPIFFFAGPPVDIERVSARLIQRNLLLVWKVVSSALMRTRDARLPASTIGAALYCLDGILIKLFNTCPGMKLLVGQRT